MTNLTPDQAIPYDALLPRFLALEQRVNDLQAQLAQHEVADQVHAASIIELDDRLEKQDFNLAVLEALTTYHSDCIAALQARPGVVDPNTVYSFIPDREGYRLRSEQRERLDERFAAALLSSNNDKLTALLDDKPDPFERLSSTDEP